MKGVGSKLQVPLAKFVRCMSTPTRTKELQSSHRRHFDWIANALNITNQMDWYKVSVSELQKCSGGSYEVLSHYGHSLRNTLANIYPEFNWAPFEFSKVSNSHWKNVSNHRAYFDWIAEMLEITHQNEWYNVTNSSFESVASLSILQYYGGSLNRALSAVYPEFVWHQFLFSSTPPSYWNISQHRRQYLDWLAEELNIEKSDDWYDVPSVELSERPNVCLTFYGDSLIKALSGVYPEFEWYPWNFGNVPLRFWTYEENRRKYFDWLAYELGIHTTQEWYSVQLHSVIERRGSRALTEYGNSFINALAHIYPQYTWHPWQFTHVPSGYWQQMYNQKKYFEWAQEHFDIKKPEDWMTVTVQDVQNVKGGGLLTKHYSGSLLNALKTIYPDYNWTKLLSVSEGHNHVWSLLSKWLKQSILINYKHPQLEYSKSRKLMELDVYIPSLKLAIEYQGGQHYKEKLSVSLEEQVQRDREKMLACQQIGISLVQVPFWWSNSANALLSTIKQFRPELRFNLPRHSFPHEESEV